MSAFNRIGERVTSGYRGLEVTLGELTLAATDKVGLALTPDERQDMGMKPDAYHDPVHAGKLPARVVIGSMASVAVISAAKIKGWNP